MKKMHSYDDNYDELEVERVLAKRGRDFTTGAALVTVVIFAALNLCMAMFTEYDVGPSLLLSAIGAGLYAAGAWTGYTAFDSFVLVKRPQ
jgi:hypothetical protein